MYSKWLSWALAALLIAGSTSCSLALNEEEKQAPLLNVNPDQEGCLANAGTVLSRFFNGEVSHSELDKFWECMIRSFVLFTDSSKGKNEDYYTPQELVLFLERYFLNGKKVPPTLVTEAMILKKGVLGGSVDKITRDELRSTLNLMRAFQRESLRIRPLLPIHFDSPKNKDSEAFESSLALLEDALQNIGKAFQGSIGSYRFDSFIAFLRELEGFLYQGVSAQDDKQWVDNLTRYIEVLKPAKLLFISAPADEIRRDDWAKIFEMGPKFYSLYVRTSRYFKTPTDITYGPGLRNSAKLLKDVFVMLDRAVQNHDSRRIEFAELENLLAALQKQKFLDIEEATVKKILPLLFNRLFKVRNLNNPTYIVSEHFDNLKQALFYWSEGLLAIEGAYRHILGDIDYLVTPVEKAQLLAVPESSLLGWTMERDDTSRLAVRGMLRNIRDVKLVYPQNSGVVIIPVGRPITSVPYSHLFKTHLFRALNRVILEAYSGSARIIDDPENAVLSQEEAEAMFKEVLPILEDLGFMDKTAVKDLMARFFEANLFLYSSDGNKSLSMTEALELEAILFSTTDKAKEIHERIYKYCAGNAPADPQQKIAAACFRRQFHDSGRQYWSYIPGFARYFDKLESDSRRLMLQYLETFKRKDRMNSPVVLEDTQAFILLPYYIEAMYSRYDANNTGTLSNAEAELAYPIFRPFIAETAAKENLNDPKDHHAIYTYMLYYGKIPTENKVEFAAWRYLGEQPLATPRYNLVRVFSKVMSEWLK